MPETVPPAALRRLDLAGPTPAAQLALMALESRGRLTRNDPAPVIDAGPFGVRSVE